MTNNIYTVEDFEERLSELTIGTDDVQQLMEFVKRLDTQCKLQSKRCNVAAEMLGHDLINQCLMEEQ